MVLNGPLFRIQCQDSNQKGVPLSLKQGNRGEGAVPHLRPLMVQIQAIPPPPCPLPRGFLLFLLSLLLPERTYSHTVTRMNMGPFCRDFVHFHCRDTQQLSGTAGGEVGRVRGLPSQGTPTPTLPEVGDLCSLPQNR